MLYREIIAFCSQIHTKLLNTTVGHNVEFLNVKPGGTYSNHWAVKVKISVIKPSHLMLYREIIAVCSQIHAKHKNTLCGQNVEFVNVKLVVRIVTTGLRRAEDLQFGCSFGYEYSSILRYYTRSSGQYLPTFRRIVMSLRIEQFKKCDWPKMKALRIVKILETTYPTTECNISEDSNLQDLIVTGFPVWHTRCCLTFMGPCIVIVF